MQEHETPARILVCPTCDFPLVPVWTLPKDKIRNLQEAEIRQQLYCKTCDRRYALEELQLGAK